MNKTLITILTTAFILTGCFSTGVAMMPVTESKVKSRIILEDHIVSVGEIQSTNELIFIGNEKSYRVIEGSDALNKLKQLQADKMMINYDSPLELVVTDDKFKGYVMVTYKVYKVTELNPQEKSVLDSLGAKHSTITGYHINASISGTIHEKIDNDKLSYVDLQKARKVRLLTYETTSTVKASKVLDKVTLLPFALIADIITSPLQIYGVTQIPRFKREEELRKEKLKQSKQ